jgi:O-acetyl-ADP-ribose deacetylase
MRVELIAGDITEQRVDAIVNAANSSLLGGGGVDGAIHRKGGQEILNDCRGLRASDYGSGLPTGQAVATTAGNLPARWVIHTVGPVFKSNVDQAELLRSCYANSLAVADGLGATTVAFPLISSGVYGWPVDDAVRQALNALRAADTQVAQARLVLFGAATLATAQRVAAELDGEA